MKLQEKEEKAAARCALWPGYHCGRRRRRPGGGGLWETGSDMPESCVSEG